MAPSRLIEISLAKAPFRKLHQSAAPPFQEKKSFFWTRPLFALLAGGMLSLGFWTHPAWVWFGWPLYLASVERGTLRTYIVSSVLTGGLLGAGIFWGVLPYGTWFYFLIIVYCLGSGFLFGLLLHTLASCWYSPFFRLLFPAFLWVDLEFFRYTGPLTFPGHLAVSHADWPVFLQGAAFFGSSVVSFLIILGSTALYEGVQYLCKPERRSKELLAAVLIACVLVMLNVLTGFLILKGSGAHPTDTGARFAVVQGSISTPEYWRADQDEGFLLSLDERYFQLTEKALEEPVDWIIWPEGALNHYEMGRPAVRERLLRIAEENGVFFIIGSHRLDPQGRHFNSVFVISPEGQVTEWYDKKILVPFIESHLTPGRNDSILELPHLRLGVGICFEATSPRVGRRLLDEGAQGFAFLNNDAGLWDSPPARIHAKESILRAVESRRTVITAGQNGLSLWTDPWGRVLGRLVFFQRGILRGEIAPNRRRSFYQRGGEIFPIAVLLSTGCLVFAGLWRGQSLKVES